MENREEKFAEMQAKGYIFTLHKGWIRQEEKAEAAKEWEAFWDEFDKQTGRVKA